MRAYGLVCLLVSNVALAGFVAGCNKDGNTGSGTESAAQPSGPAVPFDNTSDERGLRSWVIGIHEAAEHAIDRASYDLDYYSEQNRERQADYDVIQYNISTSYRRPMGQGIGQRVNVAAVFFPEMDGIFYKRLSTGDMGANFLPMAEDSEPALTRWDEVIRRRVQEDDCAFPLLDPDSMVEGAYLDSMDRNILEEFQAGCAPVRAELEAGAERSAEYFLSWVTNAPGEGRIGRSGYASFTITADGRPEFETIRYE